MNFDATMKFRRNMSRAEIEAMLAECRTFAEATQAPEVARLLTGTSALSARELEGRLKTSIERLYGDHWVWARERTRQFGDRSVRVRLWLRAGCRRGGEEDLSRRRREAGAFRERRSGNDRRDVG